MEYWNVGIIVDAEFIFSITPILHHSITAKCYSIRTEKRGLRAEVERKRVIKTATDSILSTPNYLY